MRIPPGARVYLTTVISLAGVALATWFGMQAGAATVDSGWWTLGAVVASVTAAGVPAYEQIRKEQMRARAQRAAVDAAAMRDAGDHERRPEPVWPAPGGCGPACSGSRRARRGY